MCTHLARAIIRCHDDSCPPSLPEVKQCIFRWYIACPSVVRIVGVFYQFLTQEAEPSGTTLVDARNGFNELSRLAMLWTVQHLCPAGARFAFNFYWHWAQLLLHQPGGLPVTILNREGVTQGDPLSMFMYRIVLVPLD